MTTEELLAEERKIWGVDQQSLEHIVICMGKTYGDIAKQARNKLENGSIDETELKKELGNIIASTVRWTSDLGYDIEECLELALKSQRDYRKS